MDEAITEAKRRLLNNPPVAPKATGQRLPCPLPGCLNQSYRSPGHHGRGKAVPHLFRPTAPPTMAKAIALAKHPPIRNPPVAPKATGQRLPCPRQALLARQVRRRPLPG